VLLSEHSTINAASRSARRCVGHRLTREPGLFDQQAVAELRVVTMRVEQHVGALGLDELGVGDRCAQPPVVGLAETDAEPLIFSQGHGLK